MVSTRSRPKAAGTDTQSFTQAGVFQHAAARRQLDLAGFSINATPEQFQHAAARRQLEKNGHISGRWFSFNTQPPEGSWHLSTIRRYYPNGFNTQPPEGSWVRIRSNRGSISTFQHAAARRQLGSAFRHFCRICRVSTRSRPKAAGVFSRQSCGSGQVSTRSRPKAAG